MRLKSIKRIHPNFAGSFFAKYVTRNDELVNCIFKASFSISSGNVFCGVGVSSNCKVSSTSIVVVSVGLIVAR